MIFDLLKKFNYIEANNLKGLQPGFVVAQMDKVESGLLVDGKFFENGHICGIDSNGIRKGTAEDRALFIHYTEPLNTLVDSDQFYAVNVNEECPRLVQLIPGDEWMSTLSPEVVCIEGRIIEVTGTSGWYGVKTMANGDAGHHYMFLG